jgi:ABC-2 type transport system ATP-binding protein
VSTGTTVLLTTHYMFEADELCDRIAVIAGGSIVAEGTPAQLKERVADGHVVEVEVFGDAGERVEAVRGIAGVMSVAVEEGTTSQLLVVRTHAAAQVTPAVLASLDGVRVGRVATREPTLEDAYVELVRAT